jgi:hypothetical protein
MRTVARGEKIEIFNKNVYQLVENILKNTPPDRPAYDQVLVDGENIVATNGRQLLVIPAPEGAKKGLYQPTKIRGKYYLVLMSSEEVRLKQYPNYKRITDGQNIAAVRYITKETDGSQPQEYKIDKDCNGTRILYALYSRGCMVDHEYILNPMKNMEEFRIAIHPDDPGKNPVLFSFGRGGNRIDYIVMPMVNE